MLFSIDGYAGNEDCGVNEQELKVQHSRLPYLNVIRYILTHPRAIGIIFSYGCHRSLFCTLLAAPAVQTLFATYATGCEHAPVYMCKLCCLVPRPGGSRGAFGQSYGPHGCRIPILGPGMVPVAYRTSLGRDLSKGGHSHVASSGRLPAGSA